MGNKKYIIPLIIVLISFMLFSYVFAEEQTYAGELQVSGTEYQAGETAKTFVQFTRNEVAIDNGNCILDIYYPNLTKLVNNQSMMPLGENGIYTYNLTAPNTTGIYPVSAKCNYLYNATVNNYYVLEKDGIGRIDGCIANNKWDSQGDTFYTSLIDETESDGFTENFISFAGTLGSNSQQNATSFLIKNSTTGIANLMHIKINTKWGTPVDKSILYEMSMCNTTKNGLTSNMSKYADCKGSPIIVSRVANLSCLIDDGTVGMEKNIPFDTSSFEMYSGQKAIANFLLLNFSPSAIGTLTFWTTPTDTHSTSNFFRRNTNSSSQIYPQIADYELLNTGAIISNDSAQCFSPPYCLKITKNSISRTYDASNVIGLNISFYTKVTDLDSSGIAKVNFYDGTWHTIMEFQGGDEVPTYLEKSVVLSGYNFNSLNKLEFEVLYPNNSTVFYIDNISILKLVQNVTAMNTTFFVEARGSSELHITTTITETRGIVQSILDFLSGGIVNYLLQIIGITTTNQAGINQTLQEQNQTRIQIANLSSQINMTNVATKSDISALNQSIKDQLEGLSFGEAYS